MHTIKITPNLLFEYQCTSGKFIRLPNRIESKNRFGSENRIESKLFGMLYKAALLYVQSDQSTQIPIGHLLISPALIFFAPEAKDSSRLGVGRRRWPSSIGNYCLCQNRAWSGHNATNCKHTASLAATLYSFSSAKVPSRSGCFHMACNLYHVIHKTGTEVHN